MRIKMIYACDRNGYIGKNKDLLFSIPEDMLRFRKLTTGHIVVMGRRTWESLPKKHRPLIGRINAVISTKLNQREMFQEGALTFSSVMSFLNFVETDLKDKNKDVWVIGGGEIYRQFLSLADEIHMTVLDRAIGGDVVAPSISLDDWVMKERSEDLPFENTTYKFITYERKHRGEQNETSRGS